MTIHVNNSLSDSNCICEIKKYQKSMKKGDKKMTVVRRGTLVGGYEVISYGKLKQLSTDVLKYRCSSDISAVFQLQAYAGSINSNIQVSMVVFL